MTAAPPLGTISLRLPHLHFSLATVLTIRLQRAGRKKSPFYRIVVAEHSAPIQGRFLERVGHLNPLSQPNEVELKGERIEYWISVGAKPTDRVARLISSNGLSVGEKFIAKRMMKPSKAAEREAEAKRKAEEEAQKAAEEKAAAEAAAAEQAAAAQEDAAATEEVAEDSVEETASEAETAAEGTDKAAAEEAPAEDKSEEPVEEVKEEAPAEEVKSEESAEEEALAEEVKKEDAPTDEGEEEVK